MAKEVGNSLMDGVEELERKDPSTPVGSSSYHTRRWRWTNYLGGAAIFLLAVQIVTGGLLLLYYQPNSREAHDSVRTIMMDIPVGWVIRSLHHRCSHLLILIVMAHAIDVLLAKTFRRKRSPTYYTGVLLLFSILFMGFTGYLLPWDTLSVVATAVGTGLPSDIPLIGPYITQFFRGDPAIGAQTLPRFFAFHISILPMVLWVGLFFHIFFIRRHGMRRPVGSYGKRMPFYPDFILRQGLFCLWVFAILLTGAILLPAGLRPEGNPMAPAPEGIRPEWYFLAAYEVIRLGGHLTFLTKFGITAELPSLILLAGLIAVFIWMPVLDPKGRGRAWKWGVGVMVVTFVALTFYPMLRSSPGIEPLTDVAERTSELRLRALGFLAPFWMAVLTLAWILISRIHLQDRITASEMPTLH